MQISSINQISNVNLIPLRKQNKSQSVNVSMPVMNSNAILANYNKINVNFKAKRVTLGNFLDWIEQNKIREKAMKSYDELRKVQSSDLEIMAVLNVVTPKLAETKHVRYEGCFYKNHKPVETVLQYIDLIKDNESMGTYVVEFNKSGKIIDDRLVFN